MRLPLSWLWGLAVCVIPWAGQAEVIERLPTTDKVIALTFDGCEDSTKPAYLDQRIVSVLTAEKVPFTVFVTGLFALRNKHELEQLVQSPLVEIENHSMTHPQHMERLDEEHLTRQVVDADAIIKAVTGRVLQFFRFPAGHYDRTALGVVESLHHRVVHWRVPSGDPAKGVTSQHLAEWVLSSAKPGDILIFHINGRAPETADALPAILRGLRARGYHFVRLDGAL